MELFSKILRKIIWILKIPRNIILSLRYGISPSKHVYFGIIESSKPAFDRRF